MKKANERGYTLTEVSVATLIIGPLMVAFLGAGSVVGDTMDENESSADVTTQSRGIGDKIAHMLMMAHPDTIQTKPAPLLRVLKSDVVVVPKTPDFYKSTPKAATIGDVKMAMYADGRISSSEEQLLQEVSAGTISAEAALAQVGGKMEGRTISDTGGKLAEFGHTGEAITVVTSLKDMGDETHFVTPLANYAEYSQAWNHWYTEERLNRNKNSWAPIQQMVPTESIRFSVVDGSSKMNASGATETITLAFMRHKAGLLDGIDNDKDGMVDEGQLWMNYRGTSTILAKNVEVCTFTLEGRVIRLALRTCIKDSKGGIHRTTIQKRILVRNNK